MGHYQIQLQLYFHQYKVIQFTSQQLNSCNLREIVQPTNKNDHDLVTNHQWQHIAMSFIMISIYLIPLLLVIGQYQLRLVQEIIIGWKTIVKPVAVMGENVLIQQSTNGWHYQPISTNINQHRLTGNYGTHTQPGMWSSFSHYSSINHQFTMNHQYSTIIGPAMNRNGAHLFTII